MIQGWSRCLKCGCYTRRYSGITSEGDCQQYNLPKSPVEGYNGGEVEMTKRRKYGSLIYTRKNKNIKYNSNRMQD